VWLSLFQRTLSDHITGDSPPYSTVVLTSEALVSQLKLRVTLNRLVFAALLPNGDTFLSPWPLLR
jgi:hypothetical protein